MATEISVRALLGLPEEASKKAVERELGQASRRIRAFTLNLPLNSSWKKISKAYILLTPEQKDVFVHVEHEDDVITHPVSGMPIIGVRVTKDLTPLTKDHLIARYDGTWGNARKRMLYRSCVGDVLCVRPK